MRTLAAQGSSSQQVAAAAQSLNAEGMTTELYRSLLGGVETLAHANADRRALIVFSDGQAEDRAYFHEDVVRAARKSGVVIISLGFGRTVALSVALQTLRRLSEETGGLYLEAGPGFDLPADFASAIMRNVESGGRFTVDLASILKNPSVTSIRLGMGTPPARLTLDVPITTTTPNPVAAVPAPPVAAAARPVQVVTPSREGFDKWLWYAMPVALTLLLLLSLFMLYLISRRTAPPQRPSLKPVEQKALAYLVSQDDKARRIAITRTIWRIGRGADNEMVLDDSSVSRRHAEIKRSENGVFTLYDRNSLNGVYVNAARTDQSVLTEGDIVEIGDIVLRFTETPPDEHLQEQTSVQNTRAPRIS